MEYRIDRSMTAREALRLLFPQSSRRTLQNWLKAGRFSVDGRYLERENEELTAGQLLQARDTCKPQLIPDLPILYEDRYLVAIDKPEGLLSVPLDDNQRKRHALRILRDHYGSDQVFAVHRIDRETSGCLLFARGKESEERFKALFEAHEMEREYFAIVQGLVRSDRGSWTSRLLELESFRVVESHEGKPAVTHYEVLRRSRKYTYLKLLLETGRKHQIRVHCSAAGFPVLGDERYGSNEDPIRRMCLHARRIAFLHPFTGKRLEIISPIPATFKKLGVV
jgi:tRNA pseudouridine32 synthase/23S rRNA pseudouridine746 synthase/23S rRNA pseudouridine1911/1915/1917 synthase